MAATKVRRNFSWTTEMVENLVDFLSAYKSSMEYKNIYFNADKPAQYKHLRQEMAKLYADEDEVLFGPVREVLPIENIDELSNEEKAEVKRKQARQRELISKGYNRIVEKVKEIWQSFSKAVVAGSRSGCGKIIFEFYDKLVKIWGGSANTEPLSFGVSSERLNSEGDGHQDLQSEFESEDSDSRSNASGAQKRKATENAVPKLVDNKRKHLEKNLSAAKRDKILINEAKEEKEARQNLMAVMTEIII